MNQRKASAAYYLLEDMVLESPACAALKKRRRLTELQLLAGFIWASEGGCGPCPEVRASTHDKWSEYVYPAKRGAGGVVRLIVQHQCVGGLLHELAHGLGPHDKLEHGPAFRKRCFRLFRTYGGWSGEIDGPAPLKGSR